MSDEPREIELKFALPARDGEAVAALPALAGARDRALTSIYFDTPRRSLRRAGMALRVRKEAGGFVQTLKNGGDGALSRGEWEAKVARAEPVPDQLARTPAARLLKGARLSPQFTVEVRRRSADVLEGSSRIELSLDEGEVAAGGKRAPFAELELELKDGPIGGLFALARRLAAGGDLTLSFTSKAERGFALVSPLGQRALKFKAPPLAADLTAGAAFQTIARATLRQICGNAERLRRRASPEVIHQLRVGLRRLRSLNTTFGPVVADARLPALKAELEWLTLELDAARNLDVLLRGDYRAALVQKEGAEGLKGLGARLRGARRIAYARAAAAVESERFRRLLLDLLIWIEAGPWTTSADHRKRRERPVAKFAREALDHRRRKIIRKGRDIEGLEPDARHKLRIDAKKMRYAADVFAGLFHRPKRARAFVDALKAVQDTLGELNDIVVGGALVHDVAAGAGWAEAEAAFAAGRITGTQKARTGRLLERAQASLDAFADAKRFW
jgi:inorganic triphosphatase YgiF